ncbi:MAG: dipeptide epimerase [Gammaproteobacteria bacterium]|nr:dipeptide epimerase [Gammaproteobacteria bacterium]
MGLQISARHESWPIAGQFVIARGSKTAADVVVVTVTENGVSGVGECLPYPHYGESVQQTLATIDALHRSGNETITRANLIETLPAGATRNALDCALWDLEAKQTGQPVWALANLPKPEPVITAFTIGLGTLQEMGAKAELHSHRPLLKIKLGSTDETNDIERLQAIRSAAPNARLIVDANEGWSFDYLTEIAAIAADIGVELLEQPLPAADDSSLIDYQCPVPLGADESFLGDADLVELAGKYQVINLKLDKTGGLTNALSLKARAEALGLEIMIGCMVATSLSMAPALLLTQNSEMTQTARFIDLDGPLLLARDREPGLCYDGNTVSWPTGAFWGVAE